LNKVSVIVTNFNNENYLENSIKSLLEQTYKNIEIIIINDNSDDKKTLNIIKKFNKSNLHFISNSVNYGHYACANYGIDIASGDYITFLGADDILLKNHIDTLYTLINNKNYIAVYSLSQRYTKNNKLSSPKICEASIFFKKNIVLKKAGYFHMVRGGADTEFRLRLEKIFGKNKIPCTNKVTYFGLYKEETLSISKKFGKGSSVRNNYIKYFMNNLSSNKDLYYNYLECSLKCENNNFYVKNFNKNNFKKIKVF
jgi:glycosyltransferase involved in cell wall biosynthesis